MSIYYTDPASTTSIPVGCKGFYYNFEGAIDSVRIAVEMDSVEFNKVMNHNEVLAEDYTLLARAMVDIKAQNKVIHICMDNSGVFYREDLGYAYRNMALHNLVYRFFPKSSGWGNFK